LCLVGGAWQQINQAILDALKGITLADLHAPATRRDTARSGRLEVTTSAIAASENN
jgi:DNA-binding IscR family transcriptional regulator